MQFQCPSARIYAHRYYPGFRGKYEQELDGWAMAKDFVAESRLNQADESSLISEALNLFLVLHCDHGRGNVSASAASQIASAHSNVAQALAGACAGLAGPRHGLASQQALEFVDSVIEKCGANLTAEAVDAVIQAHKGPIPGIGHAVLRVTDPRYTALVEFATKHGYAGKRLQAVRFIEDAARKKLSGKASSPNPNVDLASGSVMCIGEFDKTEFQTALFFLSRAIGVGAQIVIDRMLGVPITRPYEVTLDSLIHPENASSQTAYD